MSFSGLQGLPCAAEYNAYSLMLGGIFCRYMFGSLDVWYHLILRCLCLFVCCPDDLTIGESGVLKSPTIIGLVLLCIFNPIVGFL